MKKALLFPSALWNRRVSNAGVGKCLMTGVLVFVAAATIGAPQGLAVEDFSTASGETDAFRSSSYVRLHTTRIASRPGVSFVRGIMIVQLAEDLEAIIEDGTKLCTGESGLDELLGEHGLLSAERLFPWDCEEMGGGNCKFFRLTFPEDINLEAVMDELQKAPGVAHVEPVGVHPVNHYPDDFYFHLQWPLNQSEDHDINAPECWDVETGDSSIVIAIIDTGVDWEHPDLGGVAPYTGGNIWTNWNEFYGTADSDDDGNGFIDDMRGWDFVDGVSGYPGEDTNEEDNDPTDFFGHGTHVAGIAGALTDNSEGVAGLAHGCKIVPVRAGWCVYGAGGAPAGVVRMDFCAEAIYYAARNGARVINCSWANDDSGALPVAVDTAIARGAIIVVAAGNGGTSSQSVNYLSTRGDCYVVAATDSSDIRVGSSNYGTWVHFCAPGGHVASTYRSLGGEHGYAYMSGTSMAAPFVSALSGLLLSQEPSLTRVEVRSIISSTCDAIDDLNPGYGGLLGSGRINAYAALSLGSGDWQARTGGEVTSSPLPFEDGLSTYVAVTSSDSCVHVLDCDGEPVSGWPVCGLDELTSPAAGDIDDDGSVELVVGTGTGEVYAWNVSGSNVPGWPVSVGEAVVSGPMLCDLDGDGELEIVCASADSTVHVLGGDGSAQPGWPVSLSGHVTSQPCFALLGLDTTSVILVGTSDSALHALRSDGTPLGDWPVTLDSALPGSPVVLDMDGDGRSEVFVGTSDGTVYGIDDTGASLSGWPRIAAGAISSSLALGDVDGDDIPDVIAGASDGKVYAWSLGGQVLSGWPTETGAPVVSSPSLVDLDGDGSCEVAVGSDDRDLHIWSGTGEAFGGWARSTGGLIRSSPCFWDFDGDGSLELVVGSTDRKMHLWHITGSLAVDSLMAWPMYRHDAHRSGSSGFDIELPAPVVVVTAPNGGEILSEGSEFEITWIADGIGGIDSVTILYSMDGGATFSGTIATGEENDSSYVWHVPGTLSDSCLVRIIAHDPFLRSSLDDSDDFFAISAPAQVPALTVSAYPNPFVGAVTFECTVSGDRAAAGTGERGSIRLYDVSGRRLAELPVSGDGETLSLVWHGTNQATKKLASGVYFYKVEVDGMESEGRVVLLQR